MAKIGSLCRDKQTITNNNLIIKDMKKYVFFWEMSAGWDNETMTFKDELKKPVTMLGSDGLFNIDGRYSVDKINNIAKDIASKKRHCVGFSVGYLYSHDPNNAHSQSITKFTKI